MKIVTSTLNGDEIVLNQITSYRVDIGFTYDGYDSGYDGIHLSITTTDGNTHSYLVFNGDAEYPYWTWDKAESEFYDFLWALGDQTYNKYIGEAERYVKEKIENSKSYRAEQKEKSDLKAKKELWAMGVLT